MKIKFNSNVILKVVSVVIAVLLWLYIQMVVNPETEHTFKNVSVDLTNQTALLSKNLSVVGENEFDINVTLRCKRWHLTQLKSEDFMVYCDLAEIYDSGKVVLPVKVVVNNDKIAVVNRDPASITLNIEKIITAEIPLEFNMNGKVKDGYYTNEDMISSDAKTISVTGPESFVKPVTKGVVNVNVNNKSSDFKDKCSVILVNSENEAISNSAITLLKETVNVECRVFVKKAVSVKVNNVNKDLVYEIAPSSVEVAGPKELMEDFEVIEIDNFSLGSANAGYKQNIRIRLPEGMIMITEATPQFIVKGFKEAD